MKNTLLTLVVGLGLLVGASSASALTPLQNYCPQITVQLSIGSTDARTGGQVSQLQQFFASRYGNQPVTGYFGVLTRANVVRYQQEVGLSPVGMVGPYTRASLANCTDTTPPSTGTSFEATPLSGIAPLSVTFKVNSLTIGTDTSSVYVDFGDGQTAPVQPIYCIKAPCLPLANVEHVYSSPGTYTAKLMQNNNYCPSGNFCTLMYREPTVLATTLVSVSGNSQSGISLTPSTYYGKAPLGVVFNWTGVTPSKINYGDGSGDHMIATILIYPAPTTGSISHTFTQPGTYTVKLYSGDTIVALTSLIVVQ